MPSSNQQTLAESGAIDRPPILEKGNYIPWESQFGRFLENKGEDGERMWFSIIKRSYVRQMIADPDDPDKMIPEPISKTTEANKKPKEGESLDFVYERFSTLVNVMDRDDLLPIKNAGYGGNGNRNAGRQNWNQAINAGNFQVNKARGVEIHWGVNNEG
nr:hypothetical protein [Tanacetum cinerariifolium]